MYPLVKKGYPRKRKVKTNPIRAVMDCGSPAIAKAQVEGAFGMASGAATIQEVIFIDGLVQHKNFHNHNLPGINDIPPIDVDIMETVANAGGVEESGLPVFAPALTNGILFSPGRSFHLACLSCD